MGIKETSDYGYIYEFKKQQIHIFKQGIWVATFIMPSMNMDVNIELIKKFYSLYESFID